MANSSAKKRNYSTGKDSHGRMKVQGMANFGGMEQMVTFSATYGNHEFTSDEIQELLEGNDITINDFISPSGKTKPVTGRLGVQSYQGHAYVGFTRDTPVFTHTILNPKLSKMTEHNFDNDLSDIEMIDGSQLTAGSERTLPDVPSDDVENQASDEFDTMD